MLLAGCSVLVSLLYAVLFWMKTQCTYLEDCFTKIAVKRDRPDTRRNGGMLVFFLFFWYRHGHFTCFYNSFLSFQTFQENASHHVSVIPSDSDFPATFDRCGDENCPSPCKGQQYHCSLCPKIDRKPMPKQCKLKEHFRKRHWEHKITREGQSYHFSSL